MTIPDTTEPPVPFGGLKTMELIPALPWETEDVPGPTLNITVGQAVRTLLAYADSLRVTAAPVG